MKDFERADKVLSCESTLREMDGVDFLEDYISKYAVRILKERGIKNLFPPQKLAIEKGLFTDKNMVVSIPTASGKTLISELAMVKEVIFGGKCLYVVPLRALASEKFEEFKKWEKIGVKVGITTGDYESKDEWLGDSDIIVTTAEKADSLIRNKASWIEKVTCLVVDEVHLLDSSKRGPNLEILISRMLASNLTFSPKNRRIIALSATIPNSKELAKWLKAELVESNWRPVPLYEGIFYRGEIELYENLKLKENKKVGGDYTSAVLECVNSGGQVLVFDSTRRNAESTAVKLSSLNLKESDIKKLSKLSSRILEENDGEMSSKLAKCVENGVAFHHAGLLSSQRTIIEKAFKDGLIKVIVSTPTLAAGVNLPARRVIIKSYHRFSGSFNQPIKVMEYKQMVGRAGRPGMDERGEAITVVRSETAKQEVFDKYISGKPEKITSKLGSENCLRFHTLAIATEFKTVDKIEKFYESTFFFYQNEIPVWFEIERILKKLEKWDMVEFFGENRSLEVTDFGNLVSRLYIDPMTGHLFRSELERVSGKEIEELKVLHLICMSPDMERLYVRKNDEWIYEYALEFSDKFVYVPSLHSADYEWFLEEVKTALCLEEWINETDEDTICDKFGIAPGDLRRITETAEWLANALYRISEYLKHPSRVKLLAFVSRIKHGVKEELLDLVDLRGIGRVRARKLYNFGIRNKSDLLIREKRIMAEKIVGKKVVENALKSELK